MSCSLLFYPEDFVVKIGVVSALFKLDWSPLFINLVLVFFFQVKKLILHCKLLMIIQIKKTKLYIPVLFAFVCSRT